MPGKYNFVGRQAIRIYVEGLRHRNSAGLLLHSAASSQSRLMVRASRSGLSAKTQ